MMVVMILDSFVVVVLADDVPMQPSSTIPLPPERARQIDTSFDSADKLQIAVASRTLRQRSAEAK